ncbi:3-oxoacyl-ACP reductase [Ligilactobacillus pobuzihii]|uniref:3-oxoacyl-ACP reductase n=1 Tax=Ligilactobacillus pobuzihii TaxID=449659 RepID=UPI0019D0CD2B|nr:3-oxoacyl-ACP reductase [Ligilactobacillus pobuzihii]MBN7274258.1 3-oxoacyl-ACP reductase [Ligilactobacillus pobuzihii]
MSDIFSVKEQIVLVTGVASGIGHSQAQLFLKRGAVVYGADILQNSQTDSLKEEFPDNFSFFYCDVRKKADLKKVVDQVMQKSGQIDILLNTAGILDAYTPSLETTQEQWDNVLATNLTSMFLLTNLCLPQMLIQGRGVIVNMASIAGMVAGGGGAAYTAAKHGIIGYTKQLDYDYASQGIRANCIAPGAIKTPMNKADFAGEAKMAKEVAAQTPALRWADPQEVAALSLFLASRQADYIHGAVVPIDGGWTEK